MLYCFTLKLQFETNRTSCPVPLVVIPPERVPFLNRSVDQGFVLAKGRSQGTTGYIAGVEVFHHLHCLNVLRQYTWKDSYPDDMIPSLFKLNTPVVARAHADHCIDTLRQALMCAADVTPYLVYKAEPAPGSHVAAREDFQAYHKCRNFDHLLDWIKENGVEAPWQKKRGPSVDEQ